MRETITLEREHHVTVTTPERGEREYTVYFTVSAELSFTPAKLYGAMEDSEPADSDLDDFEISDVKVYATDEPDVQLTDPALVAACVAALNRDELEEALWERFHTDNG